MVYNHQTHECIAAQPYTKEFKKITAICEDGDGTMWLGTEKGIYRANCKGKQIKFTGGYEKERNLTPGKVLALYLNNYNQLLISYTDKNYPNRRKRENRILYHDLAKRTCLTDT